MPEVDNSLAGRWTNEEHQKFLLGIQLYGKNWKKIQEMITTRNCSQIRSHAQKYFLKLKKEKHHHSQPQHQQSSIQESSIDPEHSTGHVKNYDSQNYSYFMNKMYQFDQDRMEFTRTHESMDIWDAMIDSGTKKETVTVGNPEHLQDKKLYPEISQSETLRKYSESSFISD